MPGDSTDFAFEKNTYRHKHILSLYSQGLCGSTVLQFLLGIKLIKHLVTTY